MDLFGRGHILNLSDEVLLQIISRLASVGTGSDLVHLSMTSTRFHALTEDKKSVSSLSFRRDFQISPENLKKFFSSSLRCQNLLHLNLNSCFFLSSTLLRSLLVKLKSLSSLHVVDTSISAACLSSVLLVNPGLVKVSFSWWWSSAEGEVMMGQDLEPAWARLRSLAVHVNSKQYCPLDKLCCVLQKCGDLERLVVFSDAVQSSMANMPGRYDLNVQFPKELNFPRLKEYICKIDNQAYPFLMKREFCSKISSGLSSSKALEVCWDESGEMSSIFLFSKFSQLRTAYCNKTALIDCETFKNLNFLRVRGLTNLKSLPLGIKRLAIFASSHFDILEILENKSATNLESFESLEEFSILSTSKYQYPRLTPVKELEGYVGFKNLIKLCVPICIFLKNNADRKNKEVTDSSKAEESASKKMNTKQETTSIFEELTKNVSHTLEHLELLECSDQPGKSNCNGEEVLELIEKLTKLRVLLLSRFQVNVGKSKNIFSKILGSCSLLEDLKIHFLKPHGNSQGTATLIKDLGAGLALAHQMTKLSLEQNGIVESFQRFLKPAIVKCKKLEKLILVDPIKSFLIKKFPLQDTIDFLNMNTKLVFFYLRCELLTNDNIKKLKAHCKKVKQEKPHLICHFQKLVEDPSGGISVDDIKDIPAMYINVILPADKMTADDQRVSRLSPAFWSPVANITFDDVF